MTTSPISRSDGESKFFFIVLKKKDHIPKLAKMLGHNLSIGNFISFSNPHRNITIDTKNYWVDNSRENMLQGITNTGDNPNQTHAISLHEMRQHRQL